MRVVHKKEEADLPEGLLERAKFFEKNKDAAQAIKTYNDVLKENPLNEFAYNRLMILYHKEQDYKKEKATLENAIRAFEKFYETKTKRNPSKKILNLSKAFMKSTGLADRKGKLVYQKEPLGKWNKRLLVVQKRIKARNK